VIVALVADAAPDSVKLLVEQDRMYQVTGADIEAVFAACNTTTRVEQQLGEELMTTPMAAQEEAVETQDLGGYRGVDAVKVTVVDADEAVGVCGAGRYCFKVENAKEGRARIEHPDTRFTLSSNRRYELSCSVYHADLSSHFVLQIFCEGTNEHGARNAVDNEDHFTSPPGEWTRFRGVYDMPDIGDQQCMFCVSNFNTKAGPWYVDDLSVREITEAPVTRELRPKTAEEQALTLPQLNAHSVNLLHMGRPVPIAIEHAAEDGSFTAQTTITFWGNAPRGADTDNHPFTKENAYILVFRGGDPCRFARTEKLPRPEKSAPVVATFSKTTRLEKDSLLQYYQVFEGHPTDRRMWCEFKSPPRSEGNEVRLDPIPDLAPKSVPKRMRAFLWGKTDLPEERDHAWHVRLNGAFMGEATWDGRHHFVFDSDRVGEAYAPNKENVLKFVNVHDDYSPDIISLDWVEFDHEATIEPGIEYTLPADKDKPAVRTSPDFTGSPIRVFDIDGATELVVDTLPATAKGRFYTEYTYSFDGEKRRFRAVGPQDFRKPERMTLGYASRLQALDKTPEYLVITHRDFIETVRPLVELRRAQGLDTLLVDVEDIYDEYANGMFEPDAIRFFVDDVLDKSDHTGQDLKYLFLVGDATYDYIGIRPGTRNYVPTHQDVVIELVKDHAPTFAQDDYFAYGKGSSAVPLCAVGRFPCQSIETLEAYVAKVLEYEAADVPEAAEDNGSWAKRAVLVSAPSFTNSCDDIAQTVIPEWNVEKIYGTYEDTQTGLFRTRIVDAVSRGCSITFFFGHGSQYMWAMGDSVHGQINQRFTEEHVERLTNRGKYPIVFAVTCFSALFDAPLHYKSHSDSGIGIYFVEAVNKGAIALVGHVGRISAFKDYDFVRKVMSDVVQEHAERLGDAFLAAKHAYPDIAFSGDALIGDPALRVGPIFR